MRNIGNLLKQAQGMQAKLAEAQEELARREVQGQSGGGLVQVTLTAKGKAVRVKIDPSLVVPDEVAVLEDLLVAAFSDAKEKAEAVAAEEMQKITGDLPLPPGFKLPF